MKTLYLSIIILFALQSISLSQSLSIRCEDIDEGIYRCENEEVICYKTLNHYGDSIACKFKETNNEKSR
jgi:hypothetical protein